MEPCYFVDTNVLLNVGRAELDYLSSESVAFLDRHQGALVIGPLVTFEVNYRLQRSPHEFRGKRKIMRYLLACEELDFESQRELIGELELAYAQRGWHGQPGDDNDRIHAATASAFRIPYLVTWERRLREQQAWVSEVNHHHGLDPLQIVQPVETL